MPTYAYKCKKCEYKFDKFFGPSKLETYAKENPCEKCGGEVDRDFGEQNMNFMMKTYKEMNRRDNKFSKKVDEGNHTANINKDPYYDVRK